MLHLKLLISKIRVLLFLLLIFPVASYASFIEATMGAAVVNDATATYYNPAALTLLKNKQVIGLGSYAYFNSQFTGQSQQIPAGLMQSGTSTARSHYFLPSVYFGIPSATKVTIGVALISNFFDRDMEENSILRYTQSKNNVQNVDVVPALGIKLNDMFSIGANLNLSYANFLLQPVFGIPSLNIPDSQSRNESNGIGLGEDIGLLFKPLKSTLIGFNYRSSITYHLVGTSTFYGITDITSNQYAFDFWTPGRTVLTLSHFVTPDLGFLTTFQRIYWSIFKEVNVKGIATPLGIINGSIPYYLHDTWLITLGAQYKVTPKLIIRLAGSYNQSPGNPNYQISNGDSIILGGSLGYEIFKKIILDASYAHAFIKNQNIHIATGRNIINGVNKGFRDSVSVKLTVNI